MVPRQQPGLLTDGSEKIGAGDFEHKETFYEVTQILRCSLEVLQLT